MSKRKIKEIIQSFLKGNDPECVKESLQEMYHLTMMSEYDISTDERQNFTYYCKEMINLLNELSYIHKKIIKNSSSPLIALFAFLVF